MTPIVKCIEIQGEEVQSIASAVQEEIPPEEKEGTAADTDKQEGTAAETDGQEGNTSKLEQDDKPVEDVGDKPLGSEGLTKREDEKGSTGEHRTIIPCPEALHDICTAWNGIVGNAVLHLIILVSAKKIFPTHWSYSSHSFHFYLQLITVNHDLGAFVFNVGVSYGF